MSVRTCLQKRKSGIFYFRKKMPSDLLKHLQTGEFVKSLRTDDKKQARAVSNWRLCTNQFTELFGDITIDKIKAEHLIKYRNVISSLPARCTLLHPDKTMNELVALYKNQKIDALPSVRTLNARVTTLRGFLSFAIREGLLKENVAANISLAVSRKNIITRSTFSIDELNRILQGLEGHKFWIVIIGIYTGARLEEIGQLEIADIQEIDGIGYFDINDNEDKKLKTAISKRKVPIHQDLIKLGLLEYVNSARRHSNRKLFYELKESKEGRYTKGFSQWFGRHTRSLGIDDSSKVFHSLRHGFKDACREAEIPEDMHDALTGHSKGTASRGYGAGHKLHVLNKYLQCIRFDGLEIKELK